MTKGAITVADFTAQHIARTHSITLAGPSEQIFRLFSPLGEKAWAEGWDPVVVYPPSGATQEGMVFTVRQPHGQSGIWTVAAYQPEEFYIRYLVVVPDSRVSVIDIRCAPNPDQTTQVQVIYTHTALSEAGNEYIATQTEAFHRHRIDSWQAAINRYLETGQQPQHH